MPNGAENKDLLANKGVQSLIEQNSKEENLEKLLLKIKERFPKLDSGFGLFELAGLLTREDLDENNQNANRVIMSFLEETLNNLQIEKVIRDLDSLDFTDKNPEITPESLGLELVKTQTLNIQALERNQVLEELRKELPEGKKLFPTEYFYKLSYTIPETGERNFQVLSLKTYKTSTEMSEAAEKLNLKPATNAELLQYLLKNITQDNKINGKYYIATLESTNFSVVAFVPFAFWRDGELRLRAVNLAHGWRSDGGLLFVSK